MTLQQMTYIVEISKSGTISKAAQNLHMTQPSLSTAIRNLEQELEIRIFARYGKFLQFTPEGAELLVYAKQLLEQVETIKGYFGQKKQRNVVRLSVSAQHYFFTADAFIHFINKGLGEDFEVYLREGKTTEVIDDVFQQKSEIGVIFLSNSTSQLLNRILNERGIEFHHLKSVKPHIFINKNHPLANQKSITLAQLDEFPCLTYEQGYDSSSFAEEAISVGHRRQVIYVKDRATTNDVIAHTNCFNIGTGLLIEGIMRDDVISIPIDYYDSMNIGWIKLKNRVLSNEAETYLDYLALSIEKGFSGYKQ